MESRQAEPPAGPPESSASTGPAAPRDKATGVVGWLATPATVILVVVCCAGPLLIGALAAAGAGAWVAAHGYAAGAAALLVVAVVARRIRVRISRE